MARALTAAAADRLRRDGFHLRGTAWQERRVSREGVAAPD